MAATFVDVRTPPPAAPAGLVRGYAGLVVEVASADRALAFYRDLLGFEPDGQTAEGPRLRLGTDAFLVLAERPEPRTLPESGAHHAYRLPPRALEAALARLAAAGVPVHAYREDRAAEYAQNRYLADPDGNRLQLVQGAEPGIDHVALESHDVEWAEVFYSQVLGGVVETRVGWRMDDFSRAYEWGEGRDDCAPGTRRWDKRYTTVEGQARIPRPNAHFFVTLAPDADAVLGVYLATEHRQEPPPDQLVGTPRVVFRLGGGGLDALEERLRTIRLRVLPPAEHGGGPYQRRGDALYVRDPGGNFLQFCEGRA